MVLSKNQLQYREFSRFYITAADKELSKPFRQCILLFFSSLFLCFLYIPTLVLLLCFLYFFDSISKILVSIESASKTLAAEKCKRGFNSVEDRVVGAGG